VPRCSGASRVRRPIRVKLHGKKRVPLELGSQLHSAPLEGDLPPGQQPDRRAQAPAFLPTDRALAVAQSSANATRALRDQRRRAWRKEALR